MEPFTTASSITVVEHTNFAVSDHSGDILPRSYNGFFAADTRVLSRLVLRLDGRRLEPLSAANTHHDRATFYLANPRLGSLRPATVAIFRDRHVSRVMHERIRLVSYAMEPVRLNVSLEVDADFADIFEVRGTRRGIRRTVEVRNDARRTRFLYEHRGYTRTTDVTFSRPLTATDHRHEAEVTLERGRPWDLDVVVRTRRTHARGVAPFPPPRRVAPDLVRRWLARLPQLKSEDARLQRAWNQAGRDLASLLLTGPAGQFMPAAGLPWYLAVFGRDACITALQTMLLGLDIPYGTLRQLAAYQGARVDRWREEEPGKIPHEVRTGELATLEEIPFARYYGSVDATPLFVMLFVAACRWSGWLANARTHRSPAELPRPLDEFLPAVERALAWIDGMTDADGLLWYQPAHARGIVNQVWKDSGDSMRYRDGSVAVPPIAAVEVQGYTIAARRGMAEVYRALGRPEVARRHASVAKRTATALDAFWIADEGTYALGLDSGRRQIDGVGSNPGHLLWTGVVPRARASSVADRLMARDMFSGWGLRTLSSANPGYNPIAYHVGSVWPHDTSLAAAGLAAYGHRKAALRLIDGLLDAADTDPLTRLPELFAGFDRTTTPDLVPYPTACAPQAWSTGAIVLSVQALLRVTPTADGPATRPLVGGPSVQLTGLRIGDWTGSMTTR